MRRASRLIRAAGSAATLIAIIVGLPIVLWKLGSPLLPDHVPSWPEVLGVLSRPDDGHLFLGALTLLGFFAWIMLSISILVELAAALRGRVAAQIRLPGFGIGQALAAVLVAAIVTAANGASVAAWSPPPPIVSQVDAAVRPTSQQTAAPPASAEPTYTVAERDTLWDIAQRALGDPLRWREIVALNAIPDDAILHVGMKLRLPPDAVLTPERTVTVEPGDTLSAIARDELGSAQRYPEIYRRNAGQPQPDGHPLTNPDRIRPGWQLTLPTPAGAEPSPHGSPGPQPEPPQGPQSPPPPGQTPAPPSAPRTGPADPRDNLPRAQPPAASPDQTPASPAPTAQPADVPALPAALTLSGLLAAGLVTGLAVRRRRQQRHRRSYRQIAVPDPAASRLEWAAQETANTDEVTWLDLALRSLSVVLADNEADEPDILAAWLVPRGLRLILAQPCTPVTPFTTGGNDREWLLPRGTELPVSDATAVDHLAPLPALVSVGHDGDDQLLIDLERLAVLRVMGDPGRTTELLALMVAQLAFTKLCDGLDVLLVGFGAELATLDPDRLRYVDDLAAAISHLHGRLAATQETLTDHGLDTTMTGRSRSIAGDAWTPTIMFVSSSQPTTTDALAPLVDALVNAGRAAAAIVIACPHLDDAPGWRMKIDYDGSLTVPGLIDKPITANGLPPRHANTLVHLADRADAQDEPVPPASDPQPWAQDMGADGSWRPPPDASDASNGHDTDTTDAHDSAEHDSAEHDSAEVHDIEGGNPAPVITAHADREPSAPPPAAPLGPDLDRARKALTLVESQDPALDDDLAAWLAADPTGRPLISILGEPTVRAPGVFPKWRQPFFVEVLVYLALNPRGRTLEEVQADLWGDNAIAANTLRRCISEARRWAGYNTTMTPPRPYLPNISPPGGSYRLVGHLLDWDLFRRLRKRGKARIAAHIDEAHTDHEAALRLVRGPVLTPLRLGGYRWLDRHRPDLVIPGPVLDTACELVDHALSTADTTLARWAADTARLVDPGSDRPLLDLIRVAHAEDNHGEMQRFAKMLMHRTGVPDLEGLPSETYAVIYKYFPSGLDAAPAGRG